MALGLIVWGDATSGFDVRPVGLGDYGPARDGELNLIYADVPDGGWEISSPRVMLMPLKVSSSQRESRDGLAASSPGPATTSTSMKEMTRCARRTVAARSEISTPTPATRPQTSGLSSSVPANTDGLQKRRLSA